MESTLGDFVTFWTSPGPGVAGNGFSAKNDSQLRGRHSNPCPGDPFRGHFSFLKATPPNMANVYVCVIYVFRGFQCLETLLGHTHPAPPPDACRCVCVWSIVFVECVTLGVVSWDERGLRSLLCFRFWRAVRRRGNQQQQQQHKP